MLWFIVNGRLTRGITRGDGFAGEDVTMNVRTIDTIPLRLHGIGSFLKGRTEVRGEIVMYKQDFLELNAAREKEGRALFANPRNLAGRHDQAIGPKISGGASSLYFHAYDMIREDSSEIPTRSFRLRPA